MGFGYKWKDSDDEWDRKAVEYLLQQPLFKAEWQHSHRVLFECLRCQHGWEIRRPDLVARAESLALRCGVHQHKVRGVVRFIRTDADAPKYPTDRRLQKHP